MASILKAGGLALGLIVLIFVSSSFETITVADARSPYNLARQLADCNSEKQSEVAGCGGGGGSGGPARPGTPSGSTAGSSRCRNGCCGRNKLGGCKCC